MAMIPLLAMVRKDLLLFFSDRRSVIISFVAPIVIASFFGAVFSGTTGESAEPARIPVAVVDHDASPISRAVVAGLEGDRNLSVTRPTEQAARDAIANGELPAAIIIPAGFGAAAGAALFGDGERPPVDLVFDPSDNIEQTVVRGLLTQHVMQAVTSDVLGDSVRDMAIPYVVRAESTGGANSAYNGYAHSFAGMAVQFLLFAMANLGIEMLVERRRGLWKRFRSAPVSKLTLLAGKAASGTIISLLILLVSFAFAIVVFGVRIQGSVAGFLAISIGCALMASTFGLLVAAVGNTPATARGVTTLAVLMMVMLGGAWVPTFVFPAWLQEATRVVPVRWAVDGFDAMTWRGLGIGNAVAPTLVLCGFAAVFAAVAALRFRWEEI